MIKIKIKHEIKTQVYYYNVYDGREGQRNRIRLTAVRWHLCQ